MPGGRFINDWGFARSGGRTHKGTDIFAARGTKVYASDSGRVSLRSNELGGIVVVRGKVILDRDFGYGYRYAVLVEASDVKAE